MKINGKMLIINFGVIRMVMRLFVDIGIGIRFSTVFIDSSKLSVIFPVPFSSNYLMQYSYWSKGFGAASMLSKSMILMGESGGTWIVSCESTLLANSSDRWRSPSCPNMGIGF